MECCSKTNILEFVPGSRVSHVSRGNDAGSAARTPPSTRAGGQDDVSSRDNSLKQRIIQKYWVIPVNRHQYPLKIE